jgi:hypothetical protein
MTMFFALVFHVFFIRFTKDYGQSYYLPQKRIEFHEIFIKCQSIDLNGESPSSS